MTDNNTIGFCLTNTQFLQIHSDIDQPLTRPTDMPQTHLDKLQKKCTKKNKHQEIFFKLKQIIKERMD